MARRSFVNPRATVSICTKLLELEREKFSDLQWAEVHNLLGHAQRLLGEYSLAQPNLSCAIEYAEAANAKELLANSLTQQGLALIGLREYFLCVAPLSRSVELYEELA